MSEDKEKLIVVSFSGGKDSTAMLLRMIELGEHIDEVITCDVGKEFPAMYRHIEKVKGVVEAAGIKFTVLRPDKSFDHMMFEHKNSRGKHTHIIGKGWPMPMHRWCTGELKRDVMKKYFRDLSKQYVIVDHIGIAADEAYRLKRKNNQNKNHRHPLVEWGWTESDCLKYCYDSGYDWEGLYEIFDRVSCWCCPLKRIDELRNLREHFPDLWEELKDMDKRSSNQFTSRYSVEDFEKRFDLEKHFEAAGKSIRSKEFYTTLREHLNG